MLQAMQPCAFVRLVQRRTVWRTPNGCELARRGVSAVAARAVRLAVLLSPVSLEAPRRQTDTEGPLVMRVHAWVAVQTSEPTGPAFLGSLSMAALSLLAAETV